MITKGVPPSRALEGRGASALVEAFFELNQLKLLFRQGWLRQGISEARCESVAEHIFSMAVLGWWIADAHFSELDRDRMLRMVLVHELGEISTGDVTPSDGMAPEEKQRLEREGFRNVVRNLPRAEEYMALWEEFEAGETPEARFTRQLDRLEMAFQAAVYEAQDLGEVMQQFFASASAALHDPILRGIFEEIEKIRVQSTK